MERVWGLTLPLIGNTPEMRSPCSPIGMLICDFRKEDGVRSDKE